MPSKYNVVSKYDVHNMWEPLKLFVRARREGLNANLTDNAGSIHSVERILDIWSMRIVYPFTSTRQGYKKHKALCFSPWEDWSIAGEETRKKAPYFLINLADTDALNEAHRSLWKTKYFDNFSEQELKNLKVYPKNKKVIIEKK